MNFIKRAFRSAAWHLKSSLASVIIFAVVFSLVFTAFSLREYSAAVASETLESITATVVINDFSNTSYSAEADNRITQETVEKIAAHPQVVSHSTYAHTTVRRGPELVPYTTEEQLERWNIANVFEVEATNDLSIAPEFASHNHWIYQGRAFEPQDTNGALISVEVAEKNGLSVGDTITLFPKEYNDDRAVEVELLGIYSIANYLPHSQAPQFNSENLIYVTTDVIATLSGDAESKFYSMSCVISDPASVNTFIEDIESMGLPGGENLRFAVDDGHYRSVRSSVDSLTSIANAMLIASLGLGAAVILILTVLSLKGRDFELGVLLSMGESRAKVILQLFLESFLPMLAAATLALFTGRFCETWALDMLAVETAQGSFSAGGSVIAATYLCGVLLTFTGSLAAGFRVLRCRPKTLFTVVE